MHRIEFHNDADQELKAASQYYEERVEGLGDRFLNEIEEALNKVLKFPFAWPIYEDEYRRYLLKTYLYGLIYRIESETIFVIAVAHLKRKPGYRQYRGSQS